MIAHKSLSVIIACAVVLIGAGGVLAQGDDPAVNWWVVAGAGGTSTGGSVTVSDTLGQPIIGPASGSGNLGLSAGYWVTCVAAPAVAPAVTVARSGSNVILSWTADPANARYQVWVTTDPYFDPDRPGGVLPIVTAATSYTDTGAAASLENHFYVVRGLNACGAASANSARVGEFTFGLAPGSP